MKCHDVSRAQNCNIVNSHKTEREERRPERPDCGVDIRKILFAVCRAVEDLIARAPSAMKNKVVAPPDGSRGEALKVCSPFALGLRPLCA